jgi:site-specific recombinase XerD
VEGLLTAASSDRDRLLVGVLAFVGLRVGGALALRRCDVHLAERSLRLGCEVTGPHVHVPPADSFPGAATKGNGYTAPVAKSLLVLFEMYAIERDTLPETRASDWLFVNFFGPRPGAQLRYQTVYELFGRLSRRAQLERQITPHMLRHGLGSDLVAKGVDIAVIQRVMGHRSIKSTQVYARPPAAPLRAAVEAGASRLNKTLKGNQTT